MNKAHEKSLRGIMILTAALCLVVPAAIIMSADGGGGGPYGATADVEPENGYSIDISKLESDEITIFTSTSASEIAELIRITGPGGNLETSEFLIQLGSTSLNEGNNTLSIRLASDQSILIGKLHVYAVAVEPISLEAVLKEDATIFTAYQGHVDQLNQLITATVTYNNGDVIELDKSQFSVSAENFVVGERTFTVSCEIEGKSLSDTFVAEVVQQSFVNIDVSFDQKMDIPSYSRTNVLTGKKSPYGTLTVTGITPDGTRVPLNPGTQYEIIGSFWVGSNISTDHKATLIIQDHETGLIQKELVVDVEYVEPNNLYYSGSYYFTVGGTVECNDSTVTVAYDGHGQRPAGTDEYRIEYQNGNSFTVNDEYFTIVYTENGNELPVRIDGITVSDAIAYEPSFDDTYAVYNGTVQQRDMSGFDDEIMNLHVTRNDELISADEWWFDDTDGDGIYSFHAVNAGVYTIEVILEPGYSWNVSEKVEFSWTIDKAEIEPTLTLDKYKWDYGETGAIWTVNGNPGNAVPQIYYWGTSNSGITTTLDQKITDQPTLAGEWHARVYVPETANYKSGWTEQVNFEIDRKAVDPPTPIDLPYNGGYQTAEFENHSVVEYTITSSDEGKNVTEAGYNAVLTMDENCAYNYEWNGGTWADGKNTVTVTWRIVPAKIGVPSPNETGPWKYSETNEKADTKKVTFGPSPLYMIKSVSNGASYNGLEVTGDQHGTYTITFVLTDTNNYVWSDGTNETKTYDWSIEKGVNIVSTPIFSENKTEFTYGEDYKATSGSTFGIPYYVYSTTENGTYSTFESTKYLNVGSYWIKACVNGTDNYDYKESKPINITIGKATNSIQITNTEGSLDKDYDGLVIKEPGYNVTNGNVHYEYSNQENGSYIEGLPSQAGIWYIVAVVTGSTNYEDDRSEPFEVTITPVSIPYPVIKEELKYNGNYQTPTVSLPADFTGYPNGEGMDDAIEIEVVEQKDANPEYDGDTAYTLKVSPTNNYQWNKEKDGSNKYAYTLEWRIQPQSVSITIDERAHEREESANWSWHPTITEDSRFKIEYPQDTGDFGRYHILVTLNDNNYVWNVSKDTDTNGDLFDSVDNSNRLVMKVGYDITLTRYTVTFVQNDWTYGQSSGIYSAEASTSDTRIQNLIENKNGHRIEYRVVLENGGYGEVTTEVPTEAGSYQARMVTNEIPDYFSSIQSNWDDFKILPAAITGISIEGYPGATYIGEEQKVSGITTKNATTVNEQTPIWHFSNENTTDKSKFSTNLGVINAGDHTIYYYVSAPNHEDSEIKSFTLSISKVALIIEIGDKTIDYDGEIPDDSDLESVRLDITDGNLVGNDALESLDVRLKLIDASKDAKPYVIDGDCLNPNYSVTFVPGTFTISKIALDVPNARGGDTPYTGKDIDLSTLISGLKTHTSVGNDAITWTFSLTYDTEGNGYGTVMKKNAGPYEIFIMGTADNHNAYIATSSVTVTINKAELKLTVSGTTVEYGFNEPTYTIDARGFVNGENFESLEVTVIAETGYTVGSTIGTPFDITLNYKNESNLANYNVETDLGKLTVIPRNVTITMTGNSCDYDSEKTEEEDYTRQIGWDYSDGTSAYNNETLIITFDIESENYPLNVGSYDVNYVVTGEFAGNYNVTLSNPMFIVNARNVTVTTGSNNTFPYTGNVPDVNYSVNPKDARDILTFKYQILENGKYEDLGSGEDPVNVGNYRLVITGSSSDNYTASNYIIEFTIDKADYLDLVEGSSISIENYHEDYDGKLHLPTITVSGAGDSANYNYGLQWEFYIDGEITEGLVNQTNNAEVTVNIVFTISEEYRDNINAPGSLSGTVRIDPLTVDVQWGNTNLTYNGKVQTVSATFTNPADNSPVTLDVDTTTAGKTTELKNAGTYTLTASLDEENNPFGNFVLKTGGIDTEGSSQKSCTISPRSVTIVADGKTMTYGDPVPDLTWSYGDESEKFVIDGTGIEIDADSDIGIILSYSPENPAPAYGQTYKIGIDYSGLSGKNNYDITIDGGNLVVNQRHITISIHEQTHVYDGKEPEIIGSDLGTYDPTTGETTGDFHITNGKLPTNQNASGPEITLSKEPGVNKDRYNILVTCNPNYVIETNGTGTDKFEILGAEITNISASYGGFTYNDGTTLNQSQFKTSASTVNGQKYTFYFGLKEDELSKEFKFSQAGHYKVYYKVTAPNHNDSEVKSFEFDGNTAKNSINSYTELLDWTYGDVPPKITVPDSEQGSVKTIIHIDTKDGKVLDGGFTSETNAGTYWIEFRVDSGISSLDRVTPNYEFASSSYEIEIRKQPVPISWTPNEHTYDGTNKTSTITIKSYMEFGKDGEHAYSPEPSTVINDREMTMTIGVAGTYYVWIQLTDDNYCWSSLTDTNERWIQVSWTITEGGNKWITLNLDKFNGWPYDGQFYEPDVKAEHGNVYFLYSSDEDGNSEKAVYTIRPFVDAGTYWIKAVVDATESYKGLESEPKQYTISKKTVDAPVINGDTNQTYTGKEITVSLTKYEEDLVYTLDTSATQVGNYTVTVGLRYPNNYMWEDNRTSETRHLYWNILPIYVEIPNYGNGPVDENGVGYVEYKLGEWTYPFSYDPQHLNVSGDTATVKGDYTAVFTLKDTHNYAWKDSELEPEQSYELAWRIDPMKLKVPTLAHVESDYVRGGITNSVNGFNATYMSIDTGSTALSLTVSGNNVSLVTYRVSTELDDDRYWVIVGLKTGNFVWDDAVDENDRTRTLHWKVNPIVETLDLSDTVMDYTGNVVTYNPPGFDATTMLVNGNTGFSPGEYKATFSFGDSLNYVWSTDRNEYNIPEDATVTIDEDKIVVEWSITRGVYDISSLGTPKTEFVYDGKEHYPVFDSVPSWLTITHDKTITNVSDSIVKITLTFSADQDSGYTLTETTKTYDVKVIPRQVTIVIEDKEITYGDDSPELTYYVGSEFGFVDDVEIKLNVEYEAGDECENYDITGTHNAGDNYDVSIPNGTLHVKPATVPEPTETSVLYTGSAVGHPFEGPFTVDGDTVGTDLGAYTVTLTLNDNNHVWWDETSEPKTLTWTIVSGNELLLKYFVIDDSVETYTGEEIKKSVVSRTPSIVEGEDFEVYYEDNIHAGTAIIIIRGIGDHTGELKVPFTILPQEVSVPEMVDIEYDGTEKSAPYSSNELYDVSGDLKGTDVGSYHVILTLKNTTDYRWSDGSVGPKAVMWRIVSEKTLVEDYFVVDVSPEVYDGKPHTKLVECINHDLEFGVDYKVEYLNNTEASTEGNPAKIIITGIGDHDGVLEYQFVIDKMTPELTFVNDNFDRDENDGSFTLLPYLSSAIGYDELVWTSSDESVAIVDAESGEVTLTGVGNAKIVVTLPEGKNWYGCTAEYTLEVGETETEIIVVPGPGGSGGSDVIYIPTVIREKVDAGISDVTWLIILACVVTIMLALIWLLWNRRERET